MPLPKAIQLLKEPQTKRIFAALACCTLLAFAPGAQTFAASSGPDTLVKSVVDEVLAVIKDNKDPQALRTLAEQKVLPHFDFRQMTQTAVGKSWREANASQQQALENGFRSLLVNTYTASLSRSSSGAKAVEVKPVPAGTAAQGETLVKTLVKESGRPPVAIDYRMARESGDWKVVDVTVENVSLVTNYRTTFSQEIARSGIDGLIRTLQEKSRPTSKG